MQAQLTAKQRKLVTIVDPHIKKDSNYYIYKEAEAGHYLTKNKDGNTYDGVSLYSLQDHAKLKILKLRHSCTTCSILCRWCWPGSSVYTDMMNPETVDWWIKQFQLSKYQGSTADLYVWNDMNEPSVFNGPEVFLLLSVIGCAYI